MARTPPGRTRGRVLDFMRERLLDGQPPTVREVCAAVGLKAVESGRAHLEALVAAGLLDKEPGKARGYRLPGRERAVAPVPLLGRVRAGGPDLAVEEVEGYLAAGGASGNRGAGGGHELFALRVHGDSMSGLGILDGDVVIVRRQATADSGDVVVAMVGDEATVKTLHVSDDRVGADRVGGRRVELLPANPDYEPIRPDPQDLSVLGKVVELRRYFDGGPVLASVGLAAGGSA